MTSSIVPVNFSQWKSCIVKDCGIPLDRSFIESRITAMENHKDEHTVQFIRKYGKAHYALVLQWFRQALSDLK